MTLKPIVTASSMNSPVVDHVRCSAAENFCQSNQRAKLQMQTQQIDGSMMGYYNASLTARLNGLVDKTDMTSGGEPLKAQIIVQDKETADNLSKLQKQ